MALNSFEIVHQSPHARNMIPNRVGAGEVLGWVGTLASPLVESRNMVPNRVGAGEVLGWVGTLASPWLGDLTLNVAQIA